MVLLGDVFKWRLISVCLKIVLTSTQDRCTVCAKCTIGLEIILDAPDGTLTWVKWILISVYFEIVLVSTQNRSTICAERAIVSEVMLGARDGTPRLHGSSGGSFQSVWR